MLYLGENKWAGTGPARLDSLKIAHIETHVLAQGAEKGRVHHLVFSGGLGLFCLCSFLLLPLGHGLL
jgi:hypothetical protein